MAPRSEDWLNRRPHVTSGHRLDRSEGTPVVKDAADRPLARLNDPAAAFWELCDGATSIGEMVQASEHLFDTDDERIKQDVHQVFTDLAAQGLIGGF